MPKMWKAPPLLPDQLWFDVLETPRFIAQTLFTRGLRSPADMDAFLSPDDDAASGDPFALTDMDVAVRRIQNALAGHAKIAVYADFDVDGVCSAVLLVQALSSLGALAHVYIPHRVEEGYGLNCTAIGKLAESGVRLLITADCGTSSFKEIAHANSLGMDVIVTDHHHVRSELPAALAVLNPQRPDCAYPFKELAGVGVAYKLASALLPGAVPAQAAQQYLDLVALGTVVDVAPLVGENRSLARLGLAAMRQNPRPGLRALMTQARLQPGAVDSSRLAFALGPRLNAAGRIASAQTSYDLLMSRSVEEAEPLAQKLEDLNQERQSQLESGLATAREEAKVQIETSPLIFVAGESYHSGIVGLVAGRLAEEFYRPAVAIELGQPLSRGSCRSIPGFHIAAALHECSDLLERHGGHAQAAGFTVQTQRVSLLQERLAAVASRELAGKLLERMLLVDCIMPLGAATWDNLRWLQRLQPFGAGNPAPAIQSNNVRVKSAGLSGNNHLRLALTDGKATWPAIAFRQGNLAETLRAGDRIDIVYNLEEREWGGEKELQLVVLDLRPSGS